MLDDGVESGSHMVVNRCSSISICGEFNVLQDRTCISPMLITFAPVPNSEQGARRTVGVLDYIFS